MSAVWGSRPACVHRRPLDTRRAKLEPPLGPTNPKWRVPCPQGGESPDTDLTFLTHRPVCCRCWRSGTRAWGGGHIGWGARHSHHLLLLLLPTFWAAIPEIPRWVSLSRQHAEWRGITAGLRCCKNCMETNFTTTDLKLRRSFQVPKMIGGC